MWDLLQGGRQMLEPYRPEHRGVELEESLREIESWIPWAERLLTGENLEISDPIPGLIHQPPAPSGAAPDE